MTPTPPTANVLPLPLRPRDHDDAARVAISRLAERHRKGWRNAFGNLLDDWQTEGPEDGGQLDEDGMAMVSINAGEWLIARGQIHARGGLREINSDLLGNDGPYLTPGQRAWIAQVRERPLRLYRVTDVRRGEGLTLVDELDARAEPQAVRERSGSLSATPGMLMGARIMQVGDAENARDRAETEIARAWLAQRFEPAPLPQIRDAATGDPMLLVTDHYRVRDAAALAATLAAQPDVSGDAQQGWHR